MLERRIASDETGDLAFGFISAVLPTGERLFIVQPRERTILAYDTAGGFIRQIGRDGAAPGEFRSIVWAGLVGDTLWVSDPVQDRLTALDSTGKVLVARSVTVEFPGWPRKAMVRAVLAGGVLAEGGWSYEMLLGPDPAPPVPVGIAGRDGTGPRVLERLDRSRDAFALLDANGAGVLGRQPFTDSPVLVPDGHGRGFAVLHRPVTDSGPTLQVISFGAIGDTLHDRALTPRPAPLTDQVFDSAAKDAMTRAPRRDPSVFHRPRFLPVGATGFFARDGALWVSLGRGGLEGGSEWAVLDGDGRCRARLKLRLAGHLAAADGWRIWVIESDSLDVPSVARYRVVVRVPADTGC